MIDRCRRLHRALCFLLALLWCATASAYDYAYLDDFSTDKATLDSYFHSPFLEELPSPWPVEGFLMFHRGPEADYLAFYSGVGNDASARLYYAFPLIGRELVAHGVLEFDLVYSDGSMAWLRYYRSYDGSSWDWVTTVSQVGHYTFELVPPEPCSQVWIGFWGEHGGDMMLIDNLCVTLTYTTPVEGSTWSRIKELYAEGPPN
jgi:hypothetical protein